MIKITSNIIPFNGFVAFTLWPFVFVRKDRQHQYSWKTENHEDIHGEQQKEMYIIGAVLTLTMYLVGCGWYSLIAVPLFFWMYWTEWLIKFFIYGNAVAAYYNISFEREAYDNQDTLSYIEYRKPFAWKKYF